MFFSACLLLLLLRMMCVCVCVHNSIISSVFGVVYTHSIYVARIHRMYSSDNDADIEGVVWAPHIRGLHECAYVIIWYIRGACIVMVKYSILLCSETRSTKMNGNFTIRCILISRARSRCSRRTWAAIRRDSIYLAHTYAFLCFVWVCALSRVHTNTHTHLLGS